LTLNMRTLTFAGLAQRKGRMVGPTGTPPTYDRGLSRGRTLTGKPSLKRLRPV